MADGGAPARRGRPPSAGQRPRRSTKEIRERILEAAREVFAQRGYSGATTRQIATSADVAEPLIFNHFGNKADLFAVAVLQPFNDRFAQFIVRSDTLPLDRELRSAEFVRALYPFLRDNADLLLALVKSTHDMEAPHRELDAYFTSAVERMRSQYEAAGLAFDVPPELLVRYAFGMLAGAVLFEDWFFHTGKPATAVEEATLARILFKASEPAK